MGRTAPGRGRTRTATPTAGRRPQEPASPPLGGVLDFMRLIWAMDHALQKASKRMKARIGVTGPQRLVVRMVCHFPRSPAGWIARLLHVHPSTLTGVLRRLERQRLILRTVDPSDARRALFTATAKGHRINAVASGTVEAAVQRSLAGAAPRQVDGARVLLARIAAELVSSD